MNERNPFQQLVDRNLSGLQWNEGRKQKTLHAMEQERRPIYMKKKWTVIALALVLCLMTSVAFAATLMYSSRFNQEAKANALLEEKFGVTADMLSLFSCSSHEQVYRYKSLPDLAGMPGSYVADLSTGEAKWLFDGPDSAGWRADKLAEILVRCKTVGGYDAVVAEAREAAAGIGLVTPELMLPSQTELEAILAENEAREAQAQSMAIITMEDAEKLARSAIQEQYGLTDAQVQQLDFVADSTWYTMMGNIPVIEPYFGLNQNESGWTEKDGVYIVTVNALDGSIESITYDTALLGNG